MQVSGSTATVAVIVGWDLLVASVGDSEAYLDTGAEVVQVCSLHLVHDIAESLLYPLPYLKPTFPVQFAAGRDSRTPPVSHASLLPFLCLSVNALWPQGQVKFLACRPITFVLSPQAL